MQSFIWFICSLTSYLFGIVFLTQCHFFKHFFYKHLDADTQNYVIVFITALSVVIICLAKQKENQIRRWAHHISRNHFGWILKTLVEILVMSFIIFIDVAVKYPGFKKPENQEARLVSATRAYCNSTDVDLQIGSLCLLLPKDESEKQGDRSGFYAAASFSGFAFSMSRQLKLPEEYGLLYMCLEFTMKALIEIPGKGDSLLDWKLFSVIIILCFVLVVLKNYFDFCDHQNIRHDRQNGNSGSGGEDGDGGVDNNGRSGGRGNSDIFTQQVLDRSSIAGRHGGGESIRRRLGDASSTPDNELTSIACEEEIVPSVDSDEEPSPHGDLKGKHQRWDTESESEDGDDEDDNENGREMVRVQSSSNKSSSKYINVDWRFLLSVFNKGMTLNLFGDVLSNNIYSQAQSSTSQITPAQPSTSQITPAQPSTSQITPAQSSTSQITPAQSSTVQITPSQSSPSQITPAQSSPSQITPAQSRTMQITPSQSSPSQITPAQSSTSQITPAQSSTMQITPSQSNTFQITPAQPSTLQITPVSSDIDQIDEIETLKSFENQSIIRMFYELITRLKRLRDQYYKAMLKKIEAVKKSKFKQFEILVDQGSNEEALDLLNKVNYGVKIIDLLIYNKMGMAYIVGEVSPPQGELYPPQGTESKFKQLESLLGQGSNKEALDLTEEINSILENIELIIYGQMCKVPRLGEVSPPQGKESKSNQGSNEEALYLLKVINAGLEMIDLTINEHMGKTHIVGDVSPPQNKASKLKQLKTDEALELTSEIISDSETDLIKGKMSKGSIDWDPSDFDFYTTEIEFDPHTGEKSASL